MLQDPVIHSVQILHIERRERQGAMELLGEKTLPGVIPHKDNMSAWIKRNNSHIKGDAFMKEVPQGQHTCLPKLMDEIVLQDGTWCKVIAHIHEGRQGSGGEALDPLHGGRWRVSSEGVQPTLRGPGGHHLLQHRELVLVRSWRRFAGVKAGKVDLQGVDYQDNSPFESRLTAAEIRRVPGGLQQVAACAGPVHLQPYQQEAPHKEVDAHQIHGTHPEQQTQHGESLHPSRTGRRESRETERTQRSTCLGPTPAMEVLTLTRVTLFKLCDSRLQANTMLRYKTS